MDNLEYTRLVLRTEAPITLQTIVQLQQPDLRNRLRDFIRAGEDLDCLFSNGILPVGEPVLDKTTSVRLLKASIGFATESAEIAKTLFDHVYLGLPLDSKRLIGDAGDILWYMAILANALSVTFSEIEEYNIRKLQARYPEDRR